MRLRNVGEPGFVDIPTNTRLFLAETHTGRQDPVREFRIFKPDERLVETAGNQVPRDVGKEILADLPSQFRDAEQAIQVPIHCSRAALTQARGTSWAIRCSRSGRGKQRFPRLRTCNGLKPSAPARDPCSRSARERRLPAVLEYSYPTHSSKRSIVAVAYFPSSPDPSPIFVT